MLAVAPAVFSFVRLVCDKCTPNTNIYVLKRTYQAEILKIFKNIHSQPKNLTFLKKVYTTI